MAWYERDFSDTFGTELQPLGSGVVWYNPGCYSPNWQSTVISYHHCPHKNGHLDPFGGYAPFPNKPISHHISLSTPGWSLKWFKEGEWRSLSQFLHESCHFFSTVYHVGFTTGSSQSLAWVGLAWARSSLP